MTNRGRQVNEPLQNHLIIWELSAVWRGSLRASSSCDVVSNRQSPHSNRGTVQRPNVHRQCNSRYCETFESSKFSIGNSSAASWWNWIQFQLWLSVEKGRRVGSLPHSIYTCKSTSKSANIIFNKGILWCNWHIIFLVNSVSIEQQ